MIRNAFAVAIGIAFGVGGSATLLEWGRWVGKRHHGSRHQGEAGRQGREGQLL